MLYERSNGRIRIRPIARGFPGSEILSAVGLGKADIGQIALPWESGTQPLWDWEAVPGIVSAGVDEGIREALAVYQDPRTRDLYDKTFRKVKTVFLFAEITGNNGGLWTNKKIATLDDFKNVKIRATGTTMSEAVRLVGGSAIASTDPALATQLKTGLMDVVVAGITYGHQIGVSDVAKYVVHSPFVPGWSAGIIMNADKFDRLPPDLQKVVRDVSRETEQMVAFAATGELQLAEALVKGAGVEVLTFKPEEMKKMVELLAPMRAKWAQNAGPDAPALLAIIEDVVAKQRAFQVR